jgi:hypothetical protein
MKKLASTSEDGSLFYNEMGTLKDGIEKYYGRENFFVNEIVDHPNYDDFWKKETFYLILKT